MTLNEQAAAAPTEKRGFILAMGNRTPTTLRVEYLSDYDKRPVCERCGKTMSEGGYVDSTGTYQYTWWCSSLQCRKENHQAHSRAHGDDRRNVLDEHPEKVLPLYGVQRKFFNSTLESFEGNEKLVKAAQAYAEKPDGNLVFIGGTGTGKTHLACAIVRELARTGKPDVLVKSVPDLLLEIRRTFDRRTDGDHEGETEADVTDRYSSYRFLVLDDLGAEKVSEYSTSALYLIIDRRIRDAIPTIVTTNLTLEEIERKIDARLASRLAEGKVWKFTGPDRRKAAK